MGFHSTPILDDRHCELCGERFRGECPDHQQICSECNDIDFNIPHLNEDDFD